MSNGKYPPGYIPLTAHTMDPSLSNPDYKGGRRSEGGGGGGGRGGRSGGGGHQGGGRGGKGGGRRHSGGGGGGGNGNFRGRPDRPRMEGLPIDDDDTDGSGGEE